MPIFAKASKKPFSSPVSVADEATAGDGILEDIAEIGARVIDVFRAVVDVLGVNKDTDTLFWMFDN